MFIFSLPGLTHLFMYCKDLFGIIIIGAVDTPGISTLAKYIYLYCLEMPF